MKQIEHFLPANIYNDLDGFISIEKKNLTMATELLFIHKDFLGV